MVYDIKFTQLSREEKLTKLANSIYHYSDKGDIDGLEKFISENEEPHLLSSALNTEYVDGVSLARKLATDGKSSFLRLTVEKIAIKLLATIPASADMHRGEHETEPHHAILGEEAIDL